MEMKVSVWDVPHVVTVEQASSSVWIATGTYHKETFSVKDRSAKSAAAAWAEAARYRGN